MADTLRFRKFTGEKLEIAARVDDLEASAGEFLTTRAVWLADGTADGLADGLELRQHRPVPGDHRAVGYARLDSEILAGRLLHQVAAGRQYPPELARLYGDEATSAEPYALFDPYRGESLRDVGGYLSADFDQFAAGLLSGLCWLAGAGIAHRSISPDTVLWDSFAGQVQITDFSRSAPFGIARTPLRGAEAWISPESRPDSCSGIVGPTDDVWGAVRLLYYVRSNGSPLTHRGQLADFGLAETFSGMLDKVIGPPEGRPTARDLIVDGLRRRYLLPGVVDSRKPLITGREKFLNARARKYRDGQRPAVPEAFWDDVVWPPAHREAAGRQGDPR
jgi:serine/threonine protein kinase